MEITNLDHLTPQMERKSDELAGRTTSAQKGRFLSRGSGSRLSRVVREEGRQARGLTELMGNILGVRTDSSLIR